MNGPNTAKSTASQAAISTPLTRQCGFCNCSYESRPQTKNPRACLKKACQIARQTINEQEWRDKNQPQWPASYFATQRKQRHKKLGGLAERLCRSLSVGATMLADELTQMQIKAALDIWSGSGHLLLFEMLEQWDGDAWTKFIKAICALKGIALDAIEADGIANIQKFF